MPHLMLSFSADREVKDIAGQIVPTGNESISIKMMDTDKGHIVELSADAKNVKHSERKPSAAEMTLATKTLNKEPGVSRDEMARLRRQNDELQRALDKSKAELVAKNKLIVSLNGDVSELQKKQIADEYKAFLAAALDGHIADLAAKGQHESYEQAKYLYKHLTGISWVDEGEDGDDDDEEDD